MIKTKVENKAVIVFGENDNSLSITFHKTLRVPDNDGKVYPLPPSLGIFMIEKVSDYQSSAKIPKSWISKKDDHYFIPMFQREALWMQFNSFNKNGKRPKALKIGFGKVNSINGKPLSEKLDEKKQDYVVIPDQKWLDGFNSGDGFIKQFVAMSEGSKTSIEYQVTGKENNKGIQLLMFDNKYIHKEKEKEQKILKPKVYDPFFDPKPKAYDPFFNPSIQKKHDCNSDSDSMDDYEESKEEEYQPIKYKRNTQGNAWRKNRGNIEDGLFTSVNEMLLKDSRRKKKAKRRTIAKEMNMSAGGKIKQKIVKDSYGYETWNQEKIGRLFIHICNPKMYQEITGREVPKSQINKSVYQSYGYPWFDLYEEKIEDVKKSNLLSKVKTVGEILNPDQKESIEVGEVTLIKPKETEVIEKELAEPTEIKEELLTLIYNMGFHDEKLNRFLLKQHKNDLQKVVRLLIEFNSTK